MYATSAEAAPEDVTMEEAAAAEFVQPAEDAPDAAGAEPSAGGRVAQIVAAVLRQARTRAEGDTLFQKLRAPDAVADALGMPAACQSEELEEAYQRCVPHWDKSQEREVDYIV